MQDIKNHLRRLLKTITGGDWWIDSHGDAVVAFTDGGIKTVLKPQHLRDTAHRDENTGNLSYWPNDSDASWITAAQPKNITMLLDRIDVLEALLTEHSIPLPAEIMHSDGPSCTAVQESATQ